MNLIKSTNNWKSSLQYIQYPAEAYNYHNMMSLGTRLKDIYWKTISKDKIINEHCVEKLIVESAKKWVMEEDGAFREDICNLFIKKFQDYKTAITIKIIKNL